MILTLATPVAERPKYSGARLIVVTYIRPEANLPMQAITAKTFIRSAIVRNRDAD